MSKNINDLILFNRKEWNDKNLAMYEGSDRNRFAWNYLQLDPYYLRVIEWLHENICDLGSCSREQAIEMAKLGHDASGAFCSRFLCAR